MAFSHAYLVSLSKCWQGSPKLDERRKLWPERPTWAWFLDPERINPFGNEEALQIVSTATAHAHATKAPLWAKPIAIYRECQACVREGRDERLFEICRELARVLDTHDDAVCAESGLDLIDVPGRERRRLFRRMEEQLTGRNAPWQFRRSKPPEVGDFPGELVSGGATLAERVSRAAQGGMLLTDAGVYVGPVAELERIQLEQPGSELVAPPAASVDIVRTELEQPAAELEQPALEQPAAELEQPAAELEQPAAELEQPAAELEQPAELEPAELEQPAAKPAAVVDFTKGSPARRRRRRGD